MKTINKAFAIAALIACCGVTLNAQDFDLGTVSSPTSVVAKNKLWSQFNAVYLFRPLAPQISLYIFVRNNNPTNGHPITVRVYQTPDATLSNWTSNQGRWVEDSVQGNAGVGCTTTVAADTTVACYVVTMFAAKVAIRITGAGALAGSPDTGDLFVIQTIGEPKGQQAGSAGQQIMGTNADGTPLAGINPVVIAGEDGTNIQTAKSAATGELAVGAFDTPTDGEPNSVIYMKYGAAGAGQQFPLGVLPFVFDENGNTWDRLRGSKPSGVKASTPFQYSAINSVSNNLSGAVYNTITNTAAGQDILNVNASAQILAFDSLILSSTAAATFDIYLTSAGGSTCTALTAQSWNISGTAASGTFTHTCTTDPTTVATIMKVNVPASGTVNISLNYLNTLSSGTGGISVKTPNAITGVVSATVFFNQITY